MQKLSLVALITVLIFSSGCNNTQQSTEEKELNRRATIEDSLMALMESPGSETKFPNVKSLSSYKNTQFIPSLESPLSREQNAVYCVTMLYAWDAARKMLPGPLRLENPSDEFKLFNQSRTYLNTLDSTDYKIKAEVEGLNIKTEATFNKSLPFFHVLTKFQQKENIVFKGKRVVSFGATGYDHETFEVIHILYYKDDNNFIIKLAPKDTAHEIILCKSEKHFPSMDKLFSEVARNRQLGEQESKIEKKRWRYLINEKDEIVIPKIYFNIEHNYTHIEGQSFTSQNQIYTFTKVWQQNAFILDEGGAGVGSNAVTWMEAAMSPEEEEKQRPKLMRFDKPFFIMLKKSNSKNPYFGVWIANTELMVLDK